MPLLRRKAHVIKASLPGDLEMDEEVFVVGCTGESFREYGDYLGAMKLYKLKVWCCSYTGRSGLTYAEALEEEAKATALLVKFPVEYEERVIRLVHHSRTRLEELVNKVYEDLRPEEPADKENGTKKVPKHPLPRSVLRRWVQEYAKETFVCGARVWIAKPELMKKYGLQTILSLDGAAAAKFAKQKKKQVDNPPQKESASAAAAQPPQGSIAACLPQERQALKECTHPVKSSAAAQVPSNLRPGGMTHTAFLILWEMGASGGRVDDIVRKAVEKKLPIEWTDSKKRVLRSTLCHNSTMFSRLGGGVYALRIHTDIEVRIGLTKDGGNANQPGSKKQASKAEENGHLSDDEVKAPTCKNLEEAIAHLQCAAEAERKAKAATQALLKELNKTEAEMELNGESTQAKDSKSTKKHVKDESTFVKSRKILSNKIKESTSQLQKASRILQAAKEEVARKQLEVRGNGNMVPSKMERKQEREEQKRLEKEQKRLEALEAKRYPIDDMELLMEKQTKKYTGGSPLSMDVCLPHAMSPKNTITTTGVLYISEFLNQFGKSLDLKSFNYHELYAVLFGGAERELLQEKSNPKSIVHLGHVYEKLLSVLLDEATAESKGSRKENRWYYVLGPGTWPEVVRRYILANQYAQKDEPIILAANALASVKVEDLPPQQHIELLEFLCDDVLGSEEMRSIIQKRLDLSESLARNMRTELAEGKQKLRDILDAEREERKRKRSEQEAAKQDTVGEGQAPDESVNGEEAPDSKKPRIAATSSELTVPCFELPEELQEYRGDPDNRKEMMLWRQKLQTAKRKLDRDQRVWEAEQRKKQRAIDFVEKARKEEEAQKLREKSNAEDAVVRIQELYEKQFRQQTVRTETIGQDRYCRNYYWGLGAHQSVIYVEDASGTWCVIDNMDDLLKLKDSLEVKGIRELQLRDSLDRHWASIDKAMRRAAKQRETGPEPLKRELPKRTARVGLSKHRGVYPFGGVDQEAILMAKESIAEICDHAKPAKIDCPHGGWKLWKTQVIELSLCSDEEESVVEVKNEIIRLVLELEEILVAGTGEESRYQDMDADDDDVDSESDDQLRQSDISIAGDSVEDTPTPLTPSLEEEGTKSWGSLSCDKIAVVNHVKEHLESEDDYSTPSWCIWNGSRERQSWRADASSARLPSHMAYSVLALAESAVPALEEFGRRFGGRK